MPTIPVPIEAFVDAWDGENPLISEKISSSSPGSAGFSQDGASSATLTYFVDGPGTDLNARNPLVAFCQQALGVVVVNDQDGSLIRIPPMAHPQFRWLYANRLSVRGVGILRNDETDISSGLVQWLTGSESSYQHTAPYVALYRKYEVSVEFGPRPYLPISDEAMDKLEDANPGKFKINGVFTTYFKDNAAPNVIAGTPFREYQRYVTFTSEASAEYMALKGGQFEFRSDVTDPPINGTVIPGFYGKTLLPKTSIKMVWYDVPYSFVNPAHENSYNIYEGLGRVNQNEFYGFKPGELLYTGFTNTQKMRNQFDEQNFNLESADIPSVSQILLADITFNFLYIPIISTNLAGDPYPPSPVGSINTINMSFVNAGHNLAMHSVNKKYYPVVAQTPKPLNPQAPLPAGFDETNFRPPYLSYPFELMFNGIPYPMSKLE